MRYAGSTEGAFAATGCHEVLLAPEIDADGPPCGSFGRADQEQPAPSADVEHCFLSFPINEIQNAIAAAELARFRVIDHQQALGKRHRARKSNGHAEPLGKSLL